MRYLTSCRLWLALGCALVSLARAEQPLTETIRVVTFPTHSRLIFKIDETVPVEWKETPSGFQAVFKGLGFTDLGAPLGDEEAWAAQFRRSLNDPRLASVELREVAGGLMIEGKWKFATGPQAPAEHKMETFDFREHAPSQFIVDFWPKSGPTIGEALALAKKGHATKKIGRREPSSSTG